MKRAVSKIVSGALASCWLQACALDRGNGFATLEEATLEVNLELDDGQLVTAQGYTVTLQQASVQVARLELQQAHEAADEEPSGDCQDDHCHGEEEEAGEEHLETAPTEMEAWFEPLVTFGYDAPLSLTARAAVPADHYDPSPELARSTPSRVLVLLERLHIEGHVSGGDLGGEQALELRIDLPLEVELSAAFAPVAIERDGPDRVHLETEIRLPPTLLDGIDFGALESDGSVILDDPEQAAASTLVASLARSEVRASLH